MLKGVHHCIVEIRQTEHPYFERALLFVREGCEERCDWQEQGRTFLRQATAHTGLRRARLVARLRTALYVLVGSAVGVLMGLIWANWR